MAENGRNGKQKIHLIDVRVQDEAIYGESWEDWPDDSTRHRRPARLERIPQRCAAIDLLAELLRHHSDVSHDDLISDDLFEELLRVAGRELFDLLFVGALRSEIATALTRVTRGDTHLLRIKLEFEGQHQAWLAELPWEYLHTPLDDDLFDAPGVFLAKRAELMLSRRLESRYLRKLGDAVPLDVLLICPRPPKRATGDPVPVNPGRVIEKFAQLEETGRVRLHRLVDPDSDVPVEDPKWVTRQAIKEAIRDHPTGPVIVHFLGHGRREGGKGQLLLSKADGRPHWIDAASFAELFGRQSLKLVVLQACDTAIPDQYVPFSGVAMALARAGLPAVVAMQYRIKTGVATAFTEAFYDKLLNDNTPIDVAVEAGRERLAEHLDARDRLAFGHPVVYLASHDGMLLDEPGPRQDPVDRNDRPGPAGNCPQCTASRRPESFLCPTCGLQFRCAGCGNEIPDPMHDDLCDTCGQRIPRRPWSADGFSVTGGPSAAAAGVVSILGGPQGDEP
jgi:hypothetical protein